MEQFGIREWMIIIGVLLLIIVLLDGIRRMRAERRDHIRVAFKMGGGVYDEAVHKSGKTAKSGDVLGSPRVIEREERIEPSIDGAAGTEPDIGDAEVYADDDLPVVTDAVIPQPQVEEDDPISVAVREKADHQRREQDDDEFNKDVEEVIILNVVSKDVDGFNGADLMKIMSHCDMRFGKRNIFHRHEQDNGAGPIQFSMANLVEPGIFDLNVIENTYTPGVCLFLTLPGPDEPMKAFDYMVEFANVFVTHLNGELKDEARSAVTAQTLAHYRQRVQEFERRRLMPD